MNFKNFQTFGEIFCLLLVFCLSLAWFLTLFFFFLLVFFLFLTKRNHFFLLFCKKRTKNRKKREKDCWIPIKSPPKVDFISKKWKWALRHFFSVFFFWHLVPFIKTRLIWDWDFLLQKKKRIETWEFHSIRTEQTNNAFYYSNECSNTVSLLNFGLAGNKNHFFFLCGPLSPFSNSVEKKTENGYFMLIETIIFLFLINPPHLIN